MSWPNWIGPQCQISIHNARKHVVPSIGYSEQLNQLGYCDVGDGGHDSVSWGLLARRYLIR